jgi:hypothetical protein
MAVEGHLEGHLDSHGTKVLKLSCPLQFWRLALKMSFHPPNFENAIPAPLGAQRFFT